MKPHKRNGRVAKQRRQEAAKDRVDRARVLVKDIFKKEGIKE